jgi:hypothetical protein
MTRPCDDGNKSDRLDKESATNELHVITCVERHRQIASDKGLREAIQRGSISRPTRVCSGKAAVVPAG